MSTLLAVGLTQYVPSDGTLVPIVFTDITSGPGTVGPVTLNVYNTDAQVGLISYSAELVPVPQAPISYENVLIGTVLGGRYAYVDVTVVPGASVTVTNIISSSILWGPASTNAEPILGQDIGGNIGENVSMLCTAVNAGDEATAFAYNAGIIPGTPPDPTADAPTLGVPSKVFAIPPTSSLVIRLPVSGASLALTPINLIASGANLYVTPVAIVG